MPLTVITLKKVPNSLRGDLTKWMQEIATGVYIGNFNSRIREKLWERVLKNLGDGEATLSYSSQNEVGYLFETYNAERRAIDFEGIPLVFLPSSEKKEGEGKKLGFSNASHLHKARKYSRMRSKFPTPTYVVLDTETTGVDSEKDQLIEIGAVLVRTSSEGQNRSFFHRLIAIDGSVPRKIENLTGISTHSLKENGVSIEEALSDLTDFLGDHIIVGYNLPFDLSFLNRALRKLDRLSLANKCVDLMSLIKKEKKRLDDYQLQTVATAYGMKIEVPHRALEDAIIISDLSMKVIEFQKILKGNV